MDCRRMAQLISPYLDGELAPREAAAVRSHLSVCADCGSDYAAMIQLSAACKHLGEVSLPAPAGFKDTLMLRINNEINDAKVITPIEQTNWFNHNWKHTAASAAAVMLLFWGVVNMNPTTSSNVQLAGKSPSVIQPDNNNYNPNNPSVTTPGNASPGASNGTNILGSTQIIENSPNTQSGTSNNPTTGNVISGRIFLNKDRAIISTMLQIKVSDSAAALEQALKLASQAQADTQNLGQQVNTNGSYTAINITVANSEAKSLLEALRSLGVITNEEVNKKDLSSRYAQTLSQYQSLITQRATLQQDAAQLAELDQRIESLSEDLQNWEQQAEHQTIVLWLEK